MKSLQQNYLDALKFSATQISTLTRLGEFCGKQDLYRQQMPEVLETLKRAAIIESSESSNRMEGVTAPPERIRKLILKSAEPRNRSEQEIAGYRDALDLLHESARDMGFRVNIVLQLHQILYRYLPGEGGRWKMTDNEIVEKYPDGTVKRIRFRPVSAVGTPHAMEDLARLYHEGANVQSREPLVLIPLTILDFLCIHPFTDGNGRAARLLTLMLLYQSNYEVGRFISLERIIEESKDTYYDTLEASSQHWHEGDHDVHPWLNYFWGVLIRAYKEFEERVGTVQSGKGSKTRLIRNTVNRKLLPFAISEIESDCPGVSREMIRLVLRQMRDEGLLELHGQGRGSKWSRIET